MQIVRKNTDIIASVMNVEGAVANGNWANDNGRNDKLCFGEDDLI